VHAPAHGQNGSARDGCTAGGGGSRVPKEALCYMQYMVP